MSITPPNRRLQRLVLHHQLDGLAHRNLTCAHEVLVVRRTDHALVRVEEPRTLFASERHVALKHSGERLAVPALVVDLGLREESLEGAAVFFG